MYKIGILTDVHGNYEALKACLEKMKDYNLNKIICAGDMIGIGASGNEVLETVINNNIECIKGNHERYYTDGFHNKLSCLTKENHDYTRNHIDQKYAQYIKDLKYRIDFNIEGFKITMIHYGMIDSSHYQPINKDKSINGFREVFKGIDSDIIIYGHDHHQSLLFDEDFNRYYYNIGATGTNTDNVGKAKFGILTLEKGKKPNIEVIYVDYEIYKERNKLVNIPCGRFIMDVFFKDDEFIKKNIFELELNPFKLFKNDAAILVAGTLEDHNCLSIGWGTFGILWKEPVASVYVKPNRYSYKYMNNNERFAICWFGDNHKEIINICGTKSGRDVNKDELCNLTPIILDETVCYKEAKLVIICEKVYENNFNKDLIKNQMALERYYKDEPVHRAYYGRIINVYEHR